MCVRMYVHVRAYCYNILSHVCGVKGVIKSKLMYLPLIVRLCESHVYISTRIDALYESLSITIRKYTTNYYLKAMCKLGMMCLYRCNIILYSRICDKYNISSPTLIYENIYISHWNTATVY